MAENSESELNAAVEALNRWVTSAPVPHSSREWRERYLRLDADVRRLYLKLDRPRFSGKENLNSMGKPILLENGAARRQ